MSKEDWRSSASYQYVADMELPLVAWEFLRRNPAYRQDYMAFGEQPGQGGDGPARRWALRFPGGPRSRRE